MYCKNCGKEIDDNADVCLNCGSYTDKGKLINSVPEVQDTISAAIVVVSILIPIIGIVIGIANINNSKPRSGKCYLAVAVITVLLVLGYLMLPVYANRAKTPTPSQTTQTQTREIRGVVEEIDKAT